MVLHSASEPAEALADQVIAELERRGHVVKL